MRPKEMEMAEGSVGGEAGRGSGSERGTKYSVNGDGESARPWGRTGGASARKRQRW